ncbi:hypothetical protein BC829DRAFT_22573 [Chytridium lagenaria]|nr:hypothetical protein BC829DRAFT_22573 [Chytridium lagenaria]
MPVKRLPFSIKKMVDNRPFTHKGVVYTSKKVSRLLAIDPMTGSIMRSFGDGEPMLEEFPIAGPQPIMLSRTEYILLIYDFDSKRVKWNITFGEFSPASMPKHLLSSQAPVGKIFPPEPRTSPLLISSSVDGLMVVGDYFDDKPYPLKFPAPALGAFDVSKMDSDGNHHLEKVFPVEDEKQKRRKKKIDEETSVFIGALNDTFYALSEKNSKLDGIAPLPIDSAKTEGNAPASSSELATVNDGCHADHPDFPKCLLGSHQVDNSLIGNSVDYPPMIGSSPYEEDGHSIESRFRKVLEGFFGKDRVADFEDIISLMEEGWARMASLAALSFLCVILTIAWMNWRSTLEPLLYPKNGMYSRVVASSEDTGEVLPQHSKSEVMILCLCLP